MPSSRPSSKPSKKSTNAVNSDAPVPIPVSKVGLESRVRDLELKIEILEDKVNRILVETERMSGHNIWNRR